MSSAEILLLQDEIAQLNTKIATDEKSLNQVQLGLKLLLEEDGKG